MILTSHIDSNKTAFIAKVQNVATALGINADWLMFVMYCESGLDSTAVNSSSGATGLIQFTNSTAAAFGVSTDDLASMSNVEQLDYVYYYLKPYAGRMNSVYDTYLAVFFPAAIGKSDDWVLQSSGLSAQKVAAYNSAIDLNGDGQITVGEFKQWVDKKIVKWGLTEALKTTAIGLGGIILVGGLFFFLYRKYKNQSHD